MYQSDKLEEYISGTQIITIDNNLKIRLSNALLNKYNNALSQLQDYIGQLII